MRDAFDIGFDALAGGGPGALHLSSLRAGALAAVDFELEVYEGGDQGAVDALHDLGRSPSRHSQYAHPRNDGVDPGWCADRILTLVPLEPAGLLDPGLTFADELDDTFVDDVDRLADLGQVWVGACVDARSVRTLWPCSLGLR